MLGGKNGLEWQVLRCRDCVDDAAIIVGDTWFDKITQWPASMYLAGVEGCFPTQIWQYGMRYNLLDIVEPVSRGASIAVWEPNPIKMQV